MVNSGVMGSITTQFDAKMNYRQHMDFGIFGDILLVANSDSAATIGINPYSEFKDKYLKQIRMDHPAVVTDLLTYADNIQVIGTSKVSDIPVYVVKIKVNDLPSRSLFIDAKNGDILKMKTKLLNPTAGSIPVTIEYAEYKKQHGVRIPMKTTLNNPMTGKAIIRYNQFKAKQKFNDSQFTIKQ